MINEHTPNSALINEIARYAPNRTEHQVAAAEYDRRFPVPAPVDRRALDAGEHCIEGDEVVDFADPTRRLTVKRIRSIRGERWVDMTDGSSWAPRPATALRWPQPAPFDHAAWVASLKVGDRAEWHFVFPNEWVALDVVSGWNGRPALQHPSGGRTGTIDIDGRGPDLIRPIPPAAPVKDIIKDAVKDIKDSAAPVVDDVAEEYAAYREASVATGVRFRETLAAKDAEIVGLRQRLADSDLLVRAAAVGIQTKDAEIAATKRTLDERNDMLMRQDAEIERLKSDLTHAKCTRDYERKALRETHVSLTACESLLRAERAEVKRLREDVSAMAYQRDVANKTITSLEQTITKLRASALVVPAKLADLRPLPWRYEPSGGSIYDSDGMFVSHVSGTLGPIIVAAANGAVKS